MSQTDDSTLESDDRIRSNIAKMMEESEREIVQEAVVETERKGFLSGWKGWALLVVIALVLWLIVS